MVQAFRPSIWRKYLIDSIGWTHLAAAKIKEPAWDCRLRDGQREHMTARSDFRLRPKVDVRSGFVFPWLPRTLLVEGPSFTKTSSRLIQAPIAGARRYCTSVSTLMKSSENLKFSKSRYVIVSAHQVGGNFSFLFGGRVRIHLPSRSWVSGRLSILQCAKRGAMRRSSDRCVWICFTLLTAIDQGAHQAGSETMRRSLRCNLMCS